MAKQININIKLTIPYIFYYIFLLYTFGTFLFADSGPGPHLTEE